MFRNSRHKIKLLGFSGLLFFLFIPILQQTTHFKSWVKPLNGIDKFTTDTSFTWPGWFSGKYQHKKNEFLEDTFGLHNYYIFLNNQVSFWAFKKTNAQKVIVGKENFLFETPYFDAYYGRDFMGETKLNDLTHKLRRIQDTLQKQNKLGFIVFAPGKATFYPEYIPDRFKGEVTISNYRFLKAQTKKLGLNNIDFNQWFLEQKTVSTYPLYPKFGIHWSNYGAVLALDSILKYINHKTTFDLPALHWDRIEISDSARFNDDDVLKAMNLIVKPKGSPMAYPMVSVKEPKEKKLRLLVVGDSFWWQIYGSAITQEIFAESRFWYYNAEMHPESATEKKYVYNIDYTPLIRQADVIIILQGESTLSQFGHGFIEMCYEAYFEPDRRNIAIAEMKKKILRSEEWYGSIVKSASTSTLSLDSLMTLNAIYAIEIDRKK